MANDILFSCCLCVRVCDHIITKVCEHNILLTAVVGIYQIYDLRVVGDEDELIRF